MNDSLQIRNAVPDDLDALTELFVTCFNEPPWNDGWTLVAARERVEAMLSGLHFRGAIALADGLAIGMILGQKERWVDAFHFNLQEMCVRSDRQRQGIGRTLLQHVTDQLRSEGTTKIYLITGPNTGAEAFYSSLGYYRMQSRVVMGSVLARS
jgi:ribosomal protein S18 acetylase RimI-like enzyme